MVDQRAWEAPDLIDPMIRRFLNEMSRDSAGHPNLADLSYPQARAVAEAVRKPWREGGPVSYTHLDVYKRQERDKRRCNARDTPVK